MTGLFVLIYLVFYVSCYLTLRPKAWIQPHPLVYPSDDPNENFITGNYLIYPENTISPSNPYDRRMGKVADAFFMPLIWVEWVCWEREVYFERWRVNNTVSPSF